MYSQSVSQSYPTPTTENRALHTFKGHYKHTQIMRTYSTVYRVHARDHRAHLSRRQPGRFIYLTSK